MLLLSINRGANSQSMVMVMVMVAMKDGPLANNGDAAIIILHTTVGYMWRGDGDIMVIMVVM